MTCHNLTGGDYIVKPALQLTGIGLRLPHIQTFLESKPPLAWVEVHSENFFGDGGKNLSLLTEVRKSYPVSLHGVGLSLGSADELNWHHLKKLRELIHHIEPCLVSDHLSWSSVGGQHFHDLFPLPYTEEALVHVASRIQQVQDFLQTQIIVENISSYISYDTSIMSEHAFLTSVAETSGCGILLDINNIHVTCTNLNHDPYAYIDAIPAEHVQEYHLGGFSREWVKDKEILIDTHDHPVNEDVWELYRYAIRQLGTKATIIEWDSSLPTLTKLCEEAETAEQIMRDTYVTTKLTG